MKIVAKILCLLLIAAAALSAQFLYAAQLYRWVDAKGNVEWRDTPPPASVPSKNIEQRRLGANVIGTGEVPFSVQLAAKNHPVTFWISSDCGKICEAGRAHLARRGVPFAEKSPKTDFEEFKRVSPSMEIPVLQVGTITLKGYLESEWDSTLDSAGYPRTGRGHAAYTCGSAGNRSQAADRWREAPTDAAAQPPQPPQATAQPAATR